MDTNITALKADYALKRELGSASCSTEVFVNDVKDPNKHTVYHFTSVYYKPDTSSKIDVKQFLNFKEIKDGKKYVITGDFNDHAEAWSDQPTAKEETPLSNILADPTCPLVCLNGKRVTRVPRGAHIDKHTASVLDLTLVSTSLGGSTWEVLSEHFFISDHFPIYGSISTGGNTKAAPPEDVFNIDKADWDRLEGYLINNAIDINNINPTDQYKRINSKLVDAANIAIPKTKYKGNYKGHAWWNDDCETAKKRLRLCSQTLYDNLTQGNYVKWHEAEREYIKIISQAKLSHWENTLKEEIHDYRDSTILWRKVKRLRKGRAPNKRPMYYTDDKGNKHICIGDKAKANLLAKAIAHKSQNSSLTNDQRTKRAEFEAEFTDPEPDNSLEFNQPITMLELQRAINDVRDKNKAAGADIITYKIIEKVPLCTKKVILQHFNTCLETGTIPDQWKEAQVFALRKMGKDPTSPDSYRPISLTPHMGKLFEKIMKERLERYLEQKSILSAFQSGFRAARSTTDNLVYLTERMKQALRSKATGRYVTMFDIHKAFDRVWHCKLLSKLKDIGISGNMYNVIKSFLSNRSMAVKFGNETSERHTLDMGSPQGAVLSPLLFIILLYDIDKDVKLGRNELLLYADDICLISKIGNFFKDDYDRKLMEEHQTAINNLSQYLKENGLSFSGEKTQFQVVSHKPIRKSLRVSVDGVWVNHSEHIKYLGLTFTHNLSWTEHFKQVARKVQGHINLLKILGHESWAKGTKFLVNVARALVRSCVSYGQECFFGSCNLDKLTTLEYRALKVALGVEKCTGNDPAIYREAGWLTLDEERKLRCAQYRVRACKLRYHPLDTFDDKERYHSDRQQAFISVGKGRTFIRNSTTTIFEYTDFTLELAGVRLTDIECLSLPPFPVREEPAMTMHFTLQNGTKKSDDVLGAGATANLYIDTHFSDYYQIYTDGSVYMNGRCGFGLFLRPPPGIKI